MLRRLGINWAKGRLRRSLGDKADLILTFTGTLLLTVQAAVMVFGSPELAAEIGEWVDSLELGSAASLPILVAIIGGGWAVVRQSYNTLARAFGWQLIGHEANPDSTEDEALVYHEALIRELGKAEKLDAAALGQGRFESVVALQRWRVNEHAHSPTWRKRAHEEFRAAASKAKRDMLRYRALYNSFQNDKGMPQQLAMRKARRVVFGEESA